MESTTKVVPREELEKTHQKILQEFEDCCKIARTNELKICDKCKIRAKIVIEFWKKYFSRVIKT